MVLIVVVKGITCVGMELWMKYQLENQIVIGLGPSAEGPPLFKICERTDDLFNECITKQRKSQSNNTFSRQQKKPNQFNQSKNNQTRVSN